MELVKSYYLKLQSYPNSQVRFFITGIQYILEFENKYDDH